MSGGCAIRASEWMATQSCYISEDRRSPSGNFSVPNLSAVLGALGRSWASAGARGGAAWPAARCRSDPIRATSANLGFCTPPSCQSCCQAPASRSPSKRIVRFSSRSIISTSTLPATLRWDQMHLSRATALVPTSATPAVGQCTSEQSEVELAPLCPAGAYLSSIER